MGDDATIALCRFGFGAAPGDTARIGAAPRDWLRGQTMPGDASHLSADLPSSASVISDFQMRRKAANADDKRAVNKMLRTQARDYLDAEIQARTSRAISGGDGFRERMVQFWSNHFTVSALGKAKVAPVAGAFEREAIRPNVMGRFEDLLFAATTHPAMLLYLDNAGSIGPASRAGARSGKGLNENHAREMMELHTLGVDGGYTQADVIALAKILTGWSIDRRTGAFQFFAARHEPGAQTLLGKSYAQTGEAQGRAALKTLGRHPATARHLARQIAVHFHSDDPPAALVVQLETAFAATGGDLSAVSQALIDAPQMWMPDLVKMKSPNDFIISAFRALAIPPLEAKRMKRQFSMFGQVPFSAPSPAGWPDTAADWAGSDAIKRRLDWSSIVARRLARKTGADPVRVAHDALGALLSERTRMAVARAETVEQGLTLLLMSPEFQRR